VSDLKEELHRNLQASRATLLSKLDNLSEYDRRRPMTPTGTNLLGLVKHLAGLEYLYLGESFGYPAPERLSWIDDGSIWQGAYMWGQARGVQRVHHRPVPARLRPRRGEVGSALTPPAG
jgi:hypothetical protein